jgi:glycosyltransferase involved in cell wall biosynthesis
VRALFFTLEKSISRWTDHFIAVSENNLNRGIELGLCGRERVTLIRSGIELGRFSEPADGTAVRSRLGIPDDSPLVLQIGNFKPQKAPFDFVRMAALVTESVPDVRFVMVGEGRLRPQAEDLATGLGVRNKFVFCGWWDDIPGLLAATQVSVMSSRHEGLPRAVVESLAAGVPVVATRVDGTPEVVRHGVNGLLTPAGDVGALAESVVSLLLDDDRRQRMAAKARDGLDEFDIDLMVQQQEELYRCLIGRSRS